MIRTSLVALLFLLSGPALAQQAAPAGPPSALPSVPPGRGAPDQAKQGDMQQQSGPPGQAKPGDARPADQTPGDERRGEAKPGADRTTRHRLALPGGVLDFTATVSTIRLANPAGAVQAEVVTTAFQLAGAAPGTRPVTFAVNGGPGASSAWLNLGAIGPWRVPLGGALPSAPPAVVDNIETWLDFTDLVFLDPPGTGFSRATGGDEARRGMQTVDGDIRVLASVVGRWLQAQGRLASPKFIVGESYGGFRGPKLARALLEQQGIGVRGLVLVSPVLDFNGRDAPWDPMRWVARLPSLAAAARGAAGRAELRDAEAYAAGDYLLDLVRGEHDADATARMSARVAALTGLDPALVRRRAGKPDFGAILRDREPGRVGSPYDSTVTAADPFPSAANDNSPDPILDGLRGPVTGAILDLYRTRLDWQPEGAPARQYVLLSETLAREWDYGRSNSRPEAMTDLRQYLALDPSARVLVAHGLTDLVTPYFASKLLLDGVPETAPPGRLQLRVYGGGHMFYGRDASRAALREDAAALVAAVTGAVPDRAAAQAR